jgi:hypothetical protein
LKGFDIKGLAFATCGSGRFLMGFGHDDEKGGKVKQKGWAEFTLIKGNNPGEVVFRRGST